ncbi:hypothetical protein [Streptomyces sp. JJ36]|uniref:hypothetical protein n=1 Tax=Streptomyces sp. JJ36 TaxID=2736645 RepID=UPI001F2B50AC|nr:hypothetical protein [Streptomyces sp. JJ36]MCF6522825.1 hypothetical protein [Streptomyces sp. JJ36]
MSVTRESCAARWAQENVGEWCAHRIPEADEAVPVLTTPIFATFAVAGAAGVAVGTARAVGGVTGHIVGATPPPGNNEVSGALEAGRPVKELLADHPAV